MTFYQKTGIKPQKNDYKKNKSFYLKPKRFFTKKNLKKKHFSGHLFLHCNNSKLYDRKICHLENPFFVPL